MYSKFKVGDHVRISNSRIHTKYVKWKGYDSLLNIVGLMKKS